MKKVCFLGGGNMASAMLAGLRRAHPQVTCHVIEPFAEARARLAESGAVLHECAHRDAVAGADAVVLAVKPQVLRDACAELSVHLQCELIVSIAAGTTLATISSWLQPADSSAVYTRIVRTMPNTPALIGQGITGVYAPSALATADLETAMTLMRSCGEVLQVLDESMIDAVTAVSGSGPAYVFHWIESMIAAAEGVGFNAIDARRLVLSTLKGATALAENSTESPSLLRERVTSKGGTTAAALAVINERRVQQALIDAVAAARDRGRELGRGGG
ncbi:MAG: pyrroline-5-carboxylate reductase [Betaproteobacteria bacterium]|nr:MAG: pyrroline-5-carboxylate reductase [Betaproteobacteria bacterium]